MKFKVNPNFVKKGKKHFRKAKFEVGDFILDIEQTQCLGKLVFAIVFEIQDKDSIIANSTDDAQGYPHAFYDNEYGIKFFKVERDDMPSKQ